MSSWIFAADAHECIEEKPKVLPIKDKKILVFLAEGHFYAMEDRCPHQGLSLQEGEVNEKVVTCPHHGARFCLKTGEPLGPPAFEKVMCYPTKIENGKVYVLVTE
jgi:3-phenylpropionate/trans-cinnamate dioxygenase ferredoxin subunit